MRRYAVALLVAALVVPLAPARVALAAPANLPSLLDGRVGSFSGGAGVVVEEGLTGKVLYAHDPDESVVTASLYKLAVLLEAERRVENGSLHYADEVTIEPEDITEDGSYELSGTVLTLDQALEKMITVSDNGAALALERILGAHQINLTLASLGIQPFTLAEDPAEDNVASPRAIATYFTLLAQRRLVSAAASGRMLQRLQRDEINDRLPAGLPAGTVVAHKTGNLGFVTHDAGIIYGASGAPMVVVAMTWSSGEEEAVEMIRDVGALVYSNELESPANVGFSVPQQPVPAETGRPLVASVRVTNLGPNAWPAGFGLVWDLRDASGTTLAKSAPLLPVGDLGAAASRDLPLVVPVPSRTGDYTLTVGLADPRLGPLAPLGAATATMTIRAHLPPLVDIQVQLSPVLHRDEASAAFVSVMPLADLTSAQRFGLGWRLVDPLTHQPLQQGSLALGVIAPGRPVGLLVPLVAPRVRGSYVLDVFALLGADQASAGVRKSVEIDAARTYAGDPSAGPLAPSLLRPGPSGGPRPSRTPAGKTPTPTFAPTPAP